MIKVLLNSCLAGPFAWFGDESGQVGNEAATVVQNQCRSQARRFHFQRFPVKFLVWHFVGVFIVSWAISSAHDLSGIGA